MGNRRDDRSSRMGSNQDEPTRGGGPARGGPGRLFDRDEDMGGAGWSGASGRGGMSYEGRGYAASNRGYGYGREGGYAGERGYGHEHGHEGDYPGDRRHHYAEEPGGYPNERRFGHQDQGRYAAERAHAGQEGGGYGYGREHAHAGEGEYGPRDDAGFIEERGFGHVPGQRWSGGYGDDREREGGFRPTGPSRDFSGRGFTGSDFGGLPPRRDRRFGAPAEMAPEPRHFGTPVDRGGRMGPGGSETTGRGYWGWDSDRASGVNVGSMGGREGYDREPAGGAGYGFRGTDMAMGAPDEEDRGPHWGKGPKGYKRSDEKTREEVCETIAHQGHIDASDVEVKVENGIVILTGTVAQRHHKRALEQLVERCRGVHEVHNELRLSSNQSRNQPRNEPSEPRDDRTRIDAPSRGQADGNQKNGKAGRA